MLETDMPKIENIFPFVFKVTVITMVFTGTGLMLIDSLELKKIRNLFTIRE